MLQTGDCLLIETNPNGYGHIQFHLFILILIYQKEIIYTIIVPVETLRSPKHDRTTVLKPGCHEFITKDSYINYRRAKITPVSDLQQHVDDGDMKVKSPFNEAILQRVCDGILKSQFTPTDVRELYQDYLYGNF